MNKCKLFVVTAASLLFVSALNGFSHKNISTKAEAEELFDFDEILKPFWEGTVSYNEAVCAIEEPDGSIAPIPLLYPIENIISVKSASLMTTYTKGTDYSIYDGKLVVKQTGSIPRIPYNDFHPETGTAGFESKDGGYVCWKEGSWYHSRQIVVTYEHKEGYDGYLVDKKGKLLPKTIEKLKNKDDINLLVFGDSVAAGGNSSGNWQVNVSPYMPIYPDLFAEGLRRTYGVNVDVINEAVGGTDSAWGVSNFTNLILNKHKEAKFDLAIINFGSNDYSHEPSYVAENVDRLVKSIMKCFPTCECMVMGCLLNNEDCPGFFMEQVNYYDAFAKNERTGVAACDVTHMCKSIVEAKKYADITGNNVNHMNDYMARCYAQTMLRTLEIDEDYKTYQEIEDEKTSTSEGSETTSEIIVTSEDTSVISSEGSVVSVETSTISEGTTPSSSSNISEDKPNDESKGCAGSIGEISSLISIFIIALLTLFIKKKDVFDRGGSSR